jgi:hypothetical protein
MGSNESEDVVFRQPRNHDERRAVAEACCTRLDLSIPCVVDTMDNAVDHLYAGWPERLFVIDRHGTVAYAGKQGPWGFDPGATERALRQTLGVSGPRPRRPGTM